MSRPTKYKSVMLKKVTRLMSAGASKVEVAAALGVTRDTIYEWSRTNQEFSDTIKMGETLSQAWWEKKARLSLEPGKINTALWFINMKNRFGWQNSPSAYSSQEEDLKEKRDAIREWMDTINDGAYDTSLMVEKKQ